MARLLSPRRCASLADPLFPSCRSLVTFVASPPTVMSTNKLPPELLKAIAGELPAEPNALSAARLRRRSLANELKQGALTILTRVSRTFYSVCTPLIYRQPLLVDNDALKSWLESPCQAGKQPPQIQKVRLQLTFPATTPEQSEC